MVYCQNDQHWPWFIATVINGALSEFFSKNKTDLRTLITCVRSLDLFYLITEREKKSVVFFIRFSSFTFVYIFTSTRKRSQLFFVRLRSFTFPPSPLLPSQSLPSPLLPSTLGLRLHPSNKSSRPASIILLNEVLHLFQSFFKRRNEWMHFLFSNIQKGKGLYASFCLQNINQCNRCGISSYFCETLFGAPSARSTRENALSFFPVVTT